MLPVAAATRLHLRPLTLDDAPAIYAYACAPKIARLGMWQPSTSLEETRDEIAEAIAGYQEGSQWTWAIE